MQHQDTICALSSAPGRAGVAVVRVSGPLAFAALGTLAGRLPAVRKAVLRTIRTPVTGEEVDRAIILRFAAPSSFTGEDVCEIHLHGGRAVVASVLRALTGLGCRLAEPGEFARRAFENGKIDLTQAEGLADLIEAETEAQRRQAMRQASGGLARLYDGWRAELITALALIEAAIDFSDEADVAADAVGQARGIVRELTARLGAHLADGRRGEILREGFRVVLAGPPNVGKSSVLNALARREAAIVSPEAGTTRDVIEVRLDLGGFPVILSDTAGLRAAEGSIEREGIRRTLAHAREADLVVWMIDATAPVVEVPVELAGLDAPVLRVVNKVDLVERSPSPRQVEVMPCARGAGARRADEGALVLAPSETARRLTPILSPEGTGGCSGQAVSECTFVSAVTGQGLAELVERIASMARDRIGAGEDVMITQERHRAALEDCRACLQEAFSSRSGAGADALEVELVAEDVRRAVQALGRITGKVDAEMVLDQVFGRFCIGK